MHISHKSPKELPRPSTIIFGCGNVLLGDDGFGPAVIQQLENCGLPATVELVDAGASIRERLLDYLLLPELRPWQIIVIDASTGGESPPGEVRLCTPSALCASKLADYSLHQFPTINLLQELQDETGIEVVLVLAATETVPTQVAPGLSPAMQTAVLKACQLVTRLLVQPACSSREAWA